MIKKILLSIYMILFLTTAFARPGDRLISIELRNNDKEICWFPDNTPLPVVVFYEEYDEMDANRLFMNMILPLAREKKIRICKVINMSPSWLLPDSFIFYDMKNDVRKSKLLEYYFDDDELLRTKWRLKSLYSGSAVLIINSSGVLVHEIYGTMEWNQAVSYASFLESVR